MNDGLDILLALLAVVAPLFLAWYLIARGIERRDSHQPREPRA